MKKSLLAFIVIATSINSIQAQSWSLQWSDEFNYSGLPDSTKWGYESGYVRNNELQYYTVKRIENARVGGGMLHIIGRKESYQGMNYTSASIITAGKYTWKYGKIEARMKLPMGKGMWPAFWMLGQNIQQVGWPKCGEIDIMEHINTENTIYGTPHWDNNGHVSNGGSVQSTPGQYHVYGIEWDSTAIKWFVDGVQYWSFNILNNINSTNEFHLPYYMLLNLAIGGSWPGSPDGTTKFPDTVFVDYVRVYKKTMAPNTVFCKNQQAPVIDGTEEASWSAVKKDTLKKIVSGTVLSSADISATYKARWDATALYFFVSVKDDSLKNDSGTATWDDDALELFLDGNNEKATAYDANDRQYIFRWNDNTVYEYRDAVAQPVNPAGVTFARQDVTGGYQVEIKVNWSTLGVTPASGKLLGFDTHMNDDDNGGGRDRKIAWFTMADQSSKDPSTFGIIKLDSTSCSLTTGFENLKEITEAIRVYPNPVSGDFSLEYFSYESKKVEVSISDVLGRRVFLETVPVSAGENVLNLSAVNFEKGVYFLSVQSTGKLLSEKIKVMK